MAQRSNFGMGLVAAMALGCAAGQESGLDVRDLRPDGVADDDSGGQDTAVVSDASDEEGIIAETDDRCPDGMVYVSGLSSCDAKMVQVPSGPFQMGYIPGHPFHHEPDQEPFHTVDVPEYWIDRLEVTVADYLACSGSGACNPVRSGGDTPFNWETPGRENHPVEGVSWSEAVAFCAWRGKRLCTEAEWEKAARGTDGRVFPWGDDVVSACEHAFVLGGADYCYEGFWSLPPGICAPGCGTGERTTPVGSMPSGASPYGALDMVGNVLEWTEDWYHASYINAPDDGSAWVLPATEERVVRSSEGATAWWALPTTYRMSFSPELPWFHLGFRCCFSGAITRTTVSLAVPNPDLERL